MLDAYRFTTPIFGRGISVKLEKLMGIVFANFFCMRARIMPKQDVSGCL